MVRIIPWKLPSVKGGSIGGYTPKVDPTPPTPDPEPPAQYYDFSSAVLSGDVIKRVFQIRFESTNLNANETKDITSQVVGIYDVWGSMGGIVPIDLIGVSSVIAKITFADTYYSSYTNRKLSGTIAISLDPITYAMSYSSTQELEVTNDTGSAATGVTSNYLMEDKVSSITFYVYNGNGEIIQSEEVVYE